jgi:rRNA processing protein Gar1
LKLIGRVFDILGPVSSPYASIKTIKQEPEKSVNRMLYVSLKKEKGERLNERR